MMYIRRKAHHSNKVQNGYPKHIDRVIFDPCNRLPERPVPDCNHWHQSDWLYPPMYPPKTHPVESPMDP